MGVTNPEGTSVDPDRHIILFDGDCGLCRRVADWVRLRDTGHRFDLIPYQEAPAPPMTPALAAACRRAVHVVRRDGRILRAGKAALFILEHTGLGVPARILAIPPLLWLVELGYQLVARNRSFFGRFLFRPGSRKP